MKNNLSITIPNIGTRKAEKLWPKINAIVAKEGIASMSVNIGAHDVNAEITHMVKKDEKPYILQFNDHTCQLVTMMNAFIYWGEKLPFKYKSEKFWDMVEECCGAEDSPIRDIDPAEEKLKIIRIYNRCTTFKGLKKWMRKQFDLNHLIDFALCRQNDLHSCVIVGYDKAHDSFKVINGKILTNESVIEYVSWERLIKHASNKKGHSWVINHTQALMLNDLPF